MTKDEAIMQLGYMLDDIRIYCDESKHVPEDAQDEMEALDMAIKALEQDSVLDQIIAEIKMYEADCRLSIDEYPSCEQCTDNVFGSIYRIIDKYKAAEELRMEKNTDRQIYDGCISLMQKMVDYFQEYLDYLGYDLDKLDEDERFFIGISNMEIVRQLFLYRTGNSGGCSTRDFCEKLGVSPYEGIKFEFEEGEEE